MATQLLIEQALALPIDERVRLAEALWQSIGDAMSAGEELDTAVDQAARRDAEMTSGAVVGRTHEEVMRAAQQAIG